MHFIDLIKFQGCTSGPIWINPLLICAVRKIDQQKKTYEHKKPEGTKISFGNSYVLVKEDPTEVVKALSESRSHR